MEPAATGDADGPGRDIPGTYMQIMSPCRLVKRLRGTPIDAHGGAYLAITPRE